MEDSGTRLHGTITDDERIYLRCKSLNFWHRRATDEDDFFVFQKRGEISVKGKGIMTTYWVFGKNHIVPKDPMQAGVPQATSPSLQRDLSHHTSLAAVVYGMMQASKRTSNVNTTRE